MFSSTETRYFRQPVPAGPDGKPIGPPPTVNLPMVVAPALVVGGLFYWKTEEILPTLAASSVVAIASFAYQNQQLYTPPNQPPPPMTTGGGSGGGSDAFADAIERWARRMNERK